MVEFSFSGKGSFYKKAVEWGKEQLNENKISDNDLDYCVLNNINCGKFEENTGNEKRWELIKEPSHRKHHLLVNNDYNDPDLCSENLYVLAAYKFTKRAQEKNFPELKFTIEKRKSQSAFCLVAQSGDKIFQTLGGDWIIDWDDVYDMVHQKNEKDSYDLIKRLQTVQWHTFWPCYRVNNHITVNQSRAWISILETLNELKICYEHQFDYDILKNNKPKALRRAFCENKEWFEYFGNIDTYKDFWDLNFISKNENMIKTNN